MKNLLSLCLLIPALSFAQFGVLDNNFDADGKVEIDVAGSSTRGHDVLVQPDGKILVCGWASTATNPAMFINRMWPDGSPDNDFGVLGQSVLTLNGITLQCYAMALQDDGKIIIVGGVNNGQTGQIVIRLNANDGFADPTFGTNGYTIIPYSTTSFLYDVAIQDDGKIVATGITSESDTDITTIRLNTDGSLDNSFSFDGKVVTDVAGIDWADGIVIDSDGKITVCGSADNGGGDVNSLLIRYNEDGSLDNTFGSNGIAETSLAPTVDEFYSLAIDGTGNIYACGTMQDGDYNLSVAKFTSAGAFDNSFSFDGIVEVDVDQGDDFAYDIVLQPDGKVLVAGSAEFQNDASLCLVRMMPDGLQDITFGNSGAVLTSSGTGDYYYGITLQDDLKIVSGGTVNDGGLKAIVARYTSGMNVGIGDVDTYIGSTLIYPNPVADQLTVEYELKSSQKVAIDLFDISGKLVAQLQPETTTPGGEHTKSFNLPALEAGNHLLQLRTENGNVGVKLTVD